MSSIVENSRLAARSGDHPDDDPMWKVLAWLQGQTLIHTLQSVPTLAQ